MLGGEIVSDTAGIMSDMASQRITVRVPASLGARVRDRSRVKGRTPSELVRVALESYLGDSSGTGSAYELAQASGLVGCVRHAPKDLSTNPRHFEGFGTSR